MDQLNVKGEMKLKRILTWPKRHKILTAVIIIGIIGGYYFFMGNKKVALPDSYTMGSVETGAIISSVAGSGSVSASNQVDIKPKISAEILKIYVKAGDKVKAGDVLAKLDDTEL